MVYFKGKIKPMVSDAMVSQVDIYRSLASFVGSDASTEDSQDLLSTFMGESTEGREELILEATSRTAFRKGDWAMIPPHKGPAINRSVNIELGNDLAYQLYDLSTDLGQKNNLAEQKPEKLAEMIKEYEEITKASDLEEKELILK
jgi:arylsulfatase A-like enzyme